MVLGCYYVSSNNKIARARYAVKETSWAALTETMERGSLIMQDQEHANDTKNTWKEQETRAIGLLLPEEVHHHVCAPFRARGLPPPD